MGDRDNAAEPWQGHRHGTRDYTRLMLALFAAGVATFSQLYSVQGVLPELSRDLGISQAQAALAVSSATLGLACSVLVWSLLADRMGRLRAMTIAVVCAVALGLAVPFSPGFEWLLALRFVEGLALGDIPAAALAYLAEEVSHLHAAVAAGTYISGTTLGGLAGRLVAGPLSEFWNWRAGTLVVGLMAAMAATVFIVVAPKPRGFTPVPRSSPHAVPLWKKLWMNLCKGSLLVLYAQGFLLMGGFVAVYNYLGFRLEAPPFLIPASLASMVFIAYLSGTWSSRQSGALVLRFARLPVLLGSIGLMAVGLLVTILDWLPAVLLGMLLFTAGFFAAHAVASGWIPLAAVGGRAQAASLYNLAYYAGSSLFGWAIGLAYAAAGWPGLVLDVFLLLALAAGLALLGLRREPASRGAKPAAGSSPGVS